MISNVTCTPTGGALQITWSMTTTTSSKQMVVLWREHGTTGWQGVTLPPATRSYTVTGLAAGVTYDYEVAAANMDAVKTATTSPPLVKGIAAGGTIQNAFTVAQLEEIAGLDARWVRFDINRAQIQRDGPTSYDWSLQDQTVQAATALGLSVLGMIGYSPGWDTTPPDPTSFGDFVYEAVGRYSEMGVTAYEIWNEPNLGTNWGGVANAAQYAAVLGDAYLAAKQADLTCTIVSGGLSPAVTNGSDISPVDFLTGMYDAVAGEFFDKLGHHPYSMPDQPGTASAWSAWAQMNTTTPSLRSVMIENGDASKMIWATELGYYTEGQGAFTEVEQAAAITTAYQLADGLPWLEAVFVYQHVDEDGESYGLLRPDGSPKPAAAAFEEAA